MAVGFLCRSCGLPSFGDFTGRAGLLECVLEVLASAEPSPALAAALGLGVLRGLTSYGALGPAPLRVGTTGVLCAGPGVLLLLALVAFATEQGGHDNITVALARFDPAAQQAPGGPAGAPAASDEHPVEDQPTGAPPEPAGSTPPVEAAYGQQQRGEEGQAGG